MSTPIAHAALNPADHVVRPVMLSMSNGTDRAILQTLLDEDFLVFDTIEGQLGELIQTRRPERKLTAEELESTVAAMLGSRPAAEYGTWAYYPWASSLVHVLPEAEFIELRTSRNRYLITAEEQATLATKRVGIVGLSVGQSVAMAIALERGAGELRLADFDTLELSNMNRIRARVFDLGLPKVVLAARAIAEMDPYLPVRCFTEGLTLHSEEAFFSEGGELDLVVDECDGLDMKVRLRETARDLGIPVVMQTSDRGMLDIERFDIEPERPFFHGLAGDLRAADLVGLSNEEKVPPLLKMIGATTLSTRATASLLEVERSIRTWPQLGSAVMFGGGIAADAVRRVLLGDLRQSGRFYVDLGAIVSDARPSSQLGAQSPLPSGEGQGEGATLPPAATPDTLIPHLISRASLAPSGGNHQPWRWVTAGNRIELYEDPAHRMGLGDFDNLGTAVALGAAAENLVLAAHAEDREVRLEISQGTDPEVPIATFELNPTSGLSRAESRGHIEPHDFDALHTQIEHRRTDRHLGDRSALSYQSDVALQLAALSVDGVMLRLITARPQIEALATLIGEGDRLRMLDPTLSREMFSELRWTKAEAKATGDGLEVDSLHLSASDRVGLELCRSPEALELIAQWDLGSGLTRLGRKWASASSALGLLTVKPADRASFFRAGRAMQRVWLTATREGLALQPLTFLPYAFARLLRGGGRAFAPATVQGLAELRPAYARMLGLKGAEGEVLLFRLFAATGSVPSSVRRSVEAVLHFD